MQREAESSNNPLLLKFVIDSVSALLKNRSRLSRGQMLQQTNLLERELKNWVRRLKDLVSAAVSEEGMDHLVRVAAEHGFEDARFGLQMQGGDNLVGWRLNMRRRPE